MQGSFARADELMRQSVEHGVFPSATLLVGQRERVLFRRAYGRLGLTEDAPRANEQTRYDLASLTKPIVTAMLTLRAVESGMLCLWDRLGTFIDAPADKADVTIRQLLTHTAGFQPGLHLWEKLATPERATELLLGCEMIAQPGRYVQYCSADYMLLGQLLECLYGQPLGELAKQEVFWPLKMAKASYRPTGDNIAPTERQPDGTLLTGAVHDENARFLGGAAGPTVRMALRCATDGLNAARTLAFDMPARNDGFTGELFPPETIGHTGFTGTSFALDPTTGLYVVFLCNRVCPSREGTAIYRVRRLLHNVVYAAKGV